MRKVLLRLLAIQGAATLAIAIGFYIAFDSPLAAGSVFYGGAMAAAVSLLLAWRVSRAQRPGAGVAGLYLSALERMVFVAAAFVFALFVLNLVPLALIAGFIGAEAAYYLAGSLLRRQA
ncbi:MAG: ATP synthase subunit I [Gammaproteobacteria bacterium]|nr:ATP synthase subunit I [Gammaproteobacteria bacterium]